ncbi:MULTISPECIES: hypothetical protein [unclassified Salinivibrio]|uniref:hypothetical protein n=1 Tax=unclassified Salinivibrio TaxID=2636825 RepID=UPI00128B7588|nr:MULTISPECIES: hypothetical protein [unclassified Salinivibrio]MPS33057.1 hypothetical protein [Salinivibrio sp. VYel7]MPX91546.1 hypothetical protein [Salinivibrio sp. VYel1]MPX94443.1 hypothetical protein [Salinivibrio sp. VYel9]MPX95073.1 hypothetical protein [Salinivibrio sp. VYel6]MPY00807.1 hypothetical protein [Salinivibrio sp. VYel4]
MRKSVVIKQTPTRLCVNDDCYTMHNIVDASVEELTWKDHLLRMLGLGILSASFLFFMLVGELPYAEYLPAVGFAAGALLALLTSAKYVLRIEYNHQDDTGVQWLTIAKSGKKTDKLLFDQHVAQLKRLLIS